MFQLRSGAYNDAYGGEDSLGEYSSELSIFGFILVSLT